MYDARVAALPAAGAARALHSVYATYADRVYDYALSLTGDEQVATEVTRDVFSLDAEDGPVPAPSQLRAWLYLRVRDAVLARRPGVLPQQRRTPPSPLTALGRKAEEIARQLPPDQAEVFDLAYRHGLGPDELRAVLGLSPHRVLGRLVAVRERLERGLGTALPPGRLPDLGLARVPDGVAGLLFADGDDGQPGGGDDSPGRHRDRAGVLGRARALVGTTVALALLVGLGLWLLPDRGTPGSDRLSPVSTDSATPDPEGSTPGAEQVTEGGSTPDGPAVPDRPEPADAGGGAEPIPGDGDPVDRVDEPTQTVLRELRVSPRQVTLARTGPDSRARITLTAVGGDVAWDAILMGATSGLIDLDVDGGRLAEGESVVVTLSVVGVPAVVGTPLTVLFQPGSELVEVTVRGR